MKHRDGIRPGCERHGPLDTVAAINNFLLWQVEQGRDAVLIIDEAQNLTEQLLSKSGCCPTRNGQSQVAANCFDGPAGIARPAQQPELRSFASESRCLPSVAVDQAEISQYIQHRLEVSGAKGAPTFHAASIVAIHHYTGGIPRLVNAVCDKALLAGYVNQTEELDYRVIAKPSMNWKRGGIVSLVNDALKRATEKHKSRPPRPLPICNCARSSRQNHIKREWVWCCLPRC